MNLHRLRRELKSIRPLIREVISQGGTKFEISVINNRRFVVKILKDSEDEHDYYSEEEDD